MPAQILGTTVLHDGFSKLLRVRLRLPDGKEISREVEDHGCAVAILPYDPQRRVALLVSLLRTPVFFSAGDVQLLEAPAGLVEESEPAETARRELLEETGLQVTALDHVGTVWTSPGISTERTDLYLACYAAKDRVGPGGGLDSENENISVIEKPLDELWSMVQAKTLTDMKTLTLLLLLQARQPQLFAASAASGAE